MDKGNDCDLIERLRNPMWAHGNVTFQSPQLEQEENLAAMKEAADEIERLRHDLDRHMQIAVDVLNDAQPASGLEPYHPKDFDGHIETFAQSVMSREKLAHTIAKQIACEEDCQKWPNGCGCALNAADVILASQPSPAATVGSWSMTADERLAMEAATRELDAEAKSILHERSSADTSDELALVLVNAERERYSLPPLLLSALTDKHYALVKRYAQTVISAGYRLATNEPQAAPVLDFFSQNVDAWGAAEWFDRMAKAIREQDAAVVAGDRMTMEMCQNVAASSAMHLVRDYEQQVRAALSLSRPKRK